MLHLKFISFKPTIFLHRRPLSCTVNPPCTESTLFLHILAFFYTSIHASTKPTIVLQIRNISGATLSVLYSHYRRRNNLILCLHHIFNIIPHSNHNHPPSQPFLNHRLFYYPATKSFLNGFFTFHAPIVAEYRLKLSQDGSGWQGPNTISGAAAQTPVLFVVVVRNYSNNSKRKIINN